MKNISVFIASLLFSTLFYQQDIGLNLSLFSIVTVIILKLNNKNAFSKRKTVLFSIAYLITAITVFVYKSNLSITANCIAFFTLIGSISEHKSSIYVKWLNGLYTSIAGFFHRNFGAEENEEITKLKKDIDYLHWFKIIGIPLTVVILFIGLYKNGNPVFNDFISKIDLSFISLQWLLITVLGYYLFNNISNPVLVDPATSIDLKTNNSLSKTEFFSEETLKKENQLANVLMAMLNLLIVFYLVTDIVYLIKINNLSAAQLSSQIHSSIYTLITSIVIAIVVILYFFRGNLNFYKHNKKLKNITYLWLTLNAILVIIIAIKNYQYIHSFGFTYKRIGVNIYLLLTFIGLLTSLLKVLNIKNIVYLVRINMQSAFAILIICSLLNWDAVITNYNINYAKVLDVDYLIDLSNNNTFLLKEYSDTKIFNHDYSKRINKKHFNYLIDLNNKNWQEIHYDSFKESKNNSTH